MKQLLLVPFCALGLFAQGPPARKSEPSIPPPVGMERTAPWPGFAMMCHVPDSMEGYPLVATYYAPGYCKGVYQITQGDNFYYYDYYWEQNP